MALMFFLFLCLSLAALQNIFLNFPVDYISDSSAIARLLLRPLNIHTPSVDPASVPGYNAADL